MQDTHERRSLWHCARRLRTAGPGGCRTAHRLFPARHTVCHVRLRRHDGERIARQARRRKREPPREEIPRLPRRKRELRLAPAVRHDADGLFLHRRFRTRLHTRARQRADCGGPAARPRRGRSGCAVHAAVRRAVSARGRFHPQKVRGAQGRPQPAVQLQTHRPDPHAQRLDAPAHAAVRPDLRRRHAPVRQRPQGAR